MMTIRPIGAGEWNTRFDPAEAVRRSAANGLRVSFQVHGGRISALEVNDAWTEQPAMAMPALTAGALTALVDILCDLTYQNSWQKGPFT